MVSNDALWCFDLNTSEIDQTRDRLEETKGREG